MGVGVCLPGGVGVSCKCVSDGRVESGSVGDRNYWNAVSSVGQAVSVS